MAAAKCWNSTHLDDRTPGVKLFTEHVLNFQMTWKQKTVEMKVEKRVRRKVNRMAMWKMVATVVKSPVRVYWRSTLVDQM